MDTLYTENSAEYSTWIGAKARCFNPNHASFNRYGGIGITMCTRWRTSFAAFLEDMGLKPQKGWQIHRVNNDGDYEPDNCIWIEPKEHTKTIKRPPQKNINFIPLKRIQKTGLTERQSQIMEFIKSQSLVPSIREIGNHFGITVKGAYDHIKALQRKGKITMQPNKARSIVVIANSQLEN